MNGTLRKQKNIFIRNSMGRKDKKSGENRSERIFYSKRKIWRRNTGEETQSTSDKRIYRWIERTKYKATSNEIETRVKSVNQLEKEVFPAQRDFETGFVCQLSIFPK